MNVALGQFADRAKKILELAPKLFFTPVASKRLPLYPSHVVKARVQPFQTQRTHPRSWPTS
jgi:hypothetical protein